MRTQPTHLEDKRFGSKRRQVLAGIGSALAAVSGVGFGQVSGQESAVTVSIDNIDKNAWKVTSVDGDETVAATGTRNPTLTLRVGTRYTFENGGGSSHPLAFRDANGEALLSQDGTGRFEDDSAVNWVDTGATAAFTLTESLAGELDDYTCTVHSAMNGAVTTVKQEQATSVTFTEQATDGTAVIVDSVQLSDGGFVAVHDSTLLDGDAVDSVVGVSEYFEPGSYDEISVELDEQLEAEQTLIAMAHRDSNGNETYDFVETDGSDDGPYTADGGAVTAAAKVTVEQTEPAASVTLTQQTTDGNFVSVNSVRVDHGGFVTIHDDTLLDGDAVDSVVGVTGYLDPGSYDNVLVGLEEQLEEDQTLIAMPHRDTNSNETYDFLNTDGGDDGPYTANGSAITDAAEVIVERPEASVTFSEQTSDGTSVTIDSVRLDDGGFVTMHDDALLDGDAPGSVVGVSGYLDPGTYDDVSVDLDERLSEKQNLIAMPHRDTDGDQTYDFVETDGSDDLPYTDAGEAVTDAAVVTVETDEIDNGGDNQSDNESANQDENETVNQSDDESTNQDDNESANQSDNESSDGSGPGFGPIAGVAGLGGLATYAYKKLQLDTEPATPASDGLDEPNGDVDKSDE